MSEAFKKNEAALSRALGRNDLGPRLQSRRIGVWSDKGSATASGVLLAEALGDVLGRFWHNLDVAGPLSDAFLRAANEAAASGGQAQRAQQGWNPAYDVVVSIAADAPAESGGLLRVGASGWMVFVGPRAGVDDDPNPAGPAAAAAIAAAEIFKRLFADALGDRAVPIPADFAWSAWSYGRNDPAPPIQSITFNDLHVIGVGAVSHSLLWVLQRWPAQVVGRVSLIDSDKYTDSNGQRYSGMRSEDIGLPKAERTALRLQAHTSLDVIPRAIDMNRYFSEERPDCNVRLATIGVDSAEHRRQLALKLPRRVVNMWTEGEWLGSARFGFSDGWPCLCCVYPENTTAPLDETGQLFQETGILPARVRELLLYSGGLTEQDVNIIRQKYPLEDPQKLVGQPLRTVRGILCATARVPLPETGAEVDVPLPFCSLLAGVAGFVELLHEVWGFASAPGKWTLRAFHYPVEGNWESDGKRSACYLCSDLLTSQLVAIKYA
jgi:hypothetical protein